MSHEHPGSIPLLLGKLGSWTGSGSPASLSDFLPSHSSNGKGKQNSLLLFTDLQEMFGFRFNLFPVKTGGLMHICP
ncbi:hypothetical protein EYF80_035949 [Liparis tanakae]|uniref:Uncharacterized protein n=1 Tax=Liparis tanakae TaxID=230148 RepID=A0A4Z2GJZ9_9TELE|nr:hypothetical protein EYF80_035949 [Liparis tanakae]